MKISNDNMFMDKKEILIVLLVPIDKNEII